MQINENHVKAICDRIEDKLSLLLDIFEFDGLLPMIAKELSIRYPWDNKEKKQ